MEYAEVLHYYLAKCGVSQAELARRLGTSRSSVGELIRGRSKTPSVYKAKAIADALGIPLQDMLDMLFDEGENKGHSLQSGNNE